MANEEIYAQYRKTIADIEEAADRTEQRAAELGKGSVEERLTLIEERLRDVMTGLALAGRQQAEQLRQQFELLF